MPAPRWRAQRHRHRHRQQHQMPQRQTLQARRRRCVAKTLPRFRRHRPLPQPGHRSEVMVLVGCELRLSAALPHWLLGQACVATRLEMRTVPQY